MPKEHIILSDPTLQLIGQNIHRALMEEIGNLAHKLQHAHSYAVRDTLTAKISTLNNICNQIHSKGHLHDEKIEKELAVE